MLAVSESQKFQNTYYILSERKDDLNAAHERDPYALVHNVVNQRLIHNITNSNCTKTIYNGQNPVLAFDVKESLAAAYCRDSTLKLWNLDTAKCLWTANTLVPMYGKVLVKIVEDNVVFAGFEKLNMHTTTRIFDLKSGNETASFATWSEENMQLCSQVCVVGKRIFTLDRNNISEWDLAGKSIRRINLHNTYPASIFLGEGNFLVYISEEDITIHNLKKNRNRKIEMASIDKKPSKISCVCLDGSRLICGVISKKQTKPSCCIIDLPSGKIIQQFPGIDKDGNRLYKPELNKIKNIIGDKEWIYLVNLHGGVMAINLVENTHHFLGTHKNYIHTLALKDGILISASVSNYFKKAELKFWDVKTHKLLATNKFNSLSRIIFDSGKVFAGVEKSFVRWDYLAAHVGEKVQANGTDQVESDSVGSN